MINHNPYILEGQVVKTDDPDQMGRVKVWVPALDGEAFNIDALPWAEYASAFAGFTMDYPAGGGPVPNDSHAAYGLWAIPKLGATVFIFCLAGDPSARFYFASSLRLHRNRSLPAGRNFDKFGKPGPWGDAGDGNGNLNPIEPAYSNLRAQFQNRVTESEAITRGMYERQVAQQQLDKDGLEGYGKSPIPGEKNLDSQTICLVTPGRHSIIFQDDPRFARVRIKTADGHQIILDDANERIYISTARGKSWFEMDSDGHINVFAADSMSFRSGKDINFFADENINFEAGKGVNVKANGADIRLSTAKEFHVAAVGAAFLSACGNINFNSEAAVKISSTGNMDLKSSGAFAMTSASSLDLKSSGEIKLAGSKIHSNGPAAATAAVAAGCAGQALAPSVVPGHEPWRRPGTTGKRGPNWKS